MCWVFLSPQKHINNSLLIGSHPVANHALASKQAKPAKADRIRSSLRLGYRVANNTNNLVGVD